jgi:hypothetical protein
VTETLPKVVAARGFGEIGGATTAGSLEEALEDAWLAVESVPEKLDIKIETWGQIDQAAPPDTIFATNSSSYPSRLMAGKMRDKSRLCNMHFYMPPEVNWVDSISRTTTPTSFGTYRRACGTCCSPASMPASSASRPVRASTPVRPSRRPNATAKSACPRQSYAREAAEPKSDVEKRPPRAGGRTGVIGATLAPAVLTRLVAE